MPEWFTKWETTKLITHDDKNNDVEKFPTLIDNCLEPSMECKELRKKLAKKKNEQYAASEESNYCPEKPESSNKSYAPEDDTYGRSSKRPNELYATQDIHETNVSFF